MNLQTKTFVWCGVPEAYVATNHHQTYHPPPSFPRPFQGIADVVETLLEDVDSYLDEASGKGANQQVSTTPSLAILENQVNLRRAFYDFKLVCWKQIFTNPLLLLRICWNPS